MITHAFRCTALPDNLDAYAIRRTPRHMEVVKDVLDSKTLWVAYGIDGEIVVSPCMHVLVSAV